MTNVFDLAQSDTRLKKVSSSGGGEYAGPCPFCGGRDRFRVQPYNKDGGRWFCRHCGGEKWNDAADYLMRRNGITYPEAKRMLEGGTIPPMVHKPAPTQAPLHQAECDPDVWQHRALEFAHYCKGNIFSSAGDEVVAWLMARGITAEIILRARLGYNPKDISDAPERWGYPKSYERVHLSHGLTIPNIDTAGIHGIKIRRGEAERKYTGVKGSAIWMYGGWSCAEDRTVGFLFESELDALVGLSSGYGCAYFALPAGQHIKPCYQYIMQDVQDVIVMPDNDAPGLAHAQALAKIPHFWAGLPTPTGKDLSEYHQSTGLDQAKLVDYLYECAGQAVEI